ncbi:Hypothetical Protein FCC1311_094752 [Hondaea fermentalgiana]|uniref:Uncharacterized protein n=1 Tax=Hondaea fermentalgiana TaxID=2315210 RepID=A0A2R5GXU4_9STRA|nr:Hypothetical Protein FCC1311_094752 [Hondaea fermentalgiana]|eukprot:GBG33251.1 Hypothetical Protein FCC1311_094752 [Hondaea fermentalgiana]
MTTERKEDEVLRALAKVVDSAILATCVFDIFDVFDIDVFDIFDIFDVFDIFGFDSGISPSRSRSTKALRLDLDALERNLSRVADEFPDILIGNEVEIEDNRVHDIEIFMLQGQRTKLANPSTFTLAIFWATWDPLQRARLQEVSRLFASCKTSEDYVVQFVAVDDSLDAVASVVDHMREVTSNDDTWSRKKHSWAGRPEDLCARHSARALRITGLVPCLVVLGAEAQIMCTYPLVVSTKEKNQANGDNEKDTSTVSETLGSAVNQDNAFDPNVAAVRLGLAAMSATTESERHLPRFTSTNEFSVWLTARANRLRGPIDFEERWERNDLVSILLLREPDLHPIARTGNSVQPIVDQ